MFFPNKNIQIVNTRNRFLSQNIQMTLNTRHTDLNNNVLVIGGSGAGKTFRFVKPQIMQMFGSYIITDPKGEISRDTSPFLKENGYSVKVLNLLNEEEMLKSSHFNPFRYVQSEVDILKLITNLISNTTPKGSSTNDPFQGKAAVGYVILNRAGGPGGNIIGVLTAPGQFSCYIPHHTVEPYISEYAQMSPEQRNGDECWLAAVGTYTGILENPIGEFRYYCNPKGCSVGETAQWAKIRAKNGDGDIIIIGDHVFCRNCW